MSDKKLPKYSWLNFTEKQQIKQFMRKNPKTSLRICQKVFEEKFQRKIGLGSIHRVKKNEKVGINLNTGIRKKAIESTLASFENALYEKINQVRFSKIKKIQIFIQHERKKCHLD